MKITEADLAAIRAELPELVRKNVEQLESHCNTAQTVGSMGLESAYRLQAILGYVETGSAGGFFHGMYMAAAVRRRFLRCVRRGMRAKKTDLLMSHDAGIHEALCSGEARVLNDLAKDKLTLESDPRVDNAYSPLFALGVRLLCMGQHQKARDPFTAFERERAGAMEGHSKIARGMLDADFVLFNDGLAELLAQRQAEIDAGADDLPTGESWLSVEGIALARLGLSSGIPVTAAHPLLPRPLLGQPTVPYPDSDALLPPVPSSFIDALGDEETE